MQGSGEDSGVDSRVGVANVDFSIVLEAPECLGRFLNGCLMVPNTIQHMF